MKSHVLALPLTLLLGAAACRGASDDSGTTGTTTATSTGTSTTTGTTTGTTTTTTTGTTTTTTGSTTTTTTGTTTTGTTAFPGYEVVSTDTTTYAAIGYVLESWEITPDADDHYTGIEGTNPRFYILRPSGSTRADAYPVLVWYHGGAVGDDTVTIPTVCTSSQVQSNIDNVLKNGSPIPDFIADNGYVLVMPRNDWCDYWQGMGPDDEVDPVYHFGYYHTRNVLDFVTSSDIALNWSYNGELYGWGTSAGGAAAVWVASQYGGFSGLIVDSSACDMDVYWAADKKSVEHIFGGPPTDPDALRRMDAASCNTIVDNGLSVPINLVWNSYDQTVEDTNMTNFEASLVAAASSGLRFASHETAHPSPKSTANTFHVQSRIGIKPFHYTTDFLFRFLKGKNGVWVEGEDGWDSACCEGITHEPPYTAAEVDVAIDINDAKVLAALVDGWENYSGWNAVKADTSVGLAKIYDAQVPASLRRLADGTAVEITPILVAEGLSGLSSTTVVASMNYVVGGKAVQTWEFTVADFPPDTGATPDRLIQSAKDLTVPASLDAPSSARINVWTTGAATVYLDGLMFTY